MVVAFYLPHLEYGGVQRVNLSLAGALVRRGHDVHLVVSSAEGPLQREIPNGAELMNLGSKRVIASVPRLARYLRRVRPQALISSKTHVNVAAVIANRLAGSPALEIVCEHSRHQFENPASYRDRLVLRLARHLYKGVDGLVAVATDVAEACSQVTGISGDEIVVIPNPVGGPELEARALEDLSVPWLRAGETTILSVGRFVREKDFATLLAAFARIRSSVDARLIILGDGVERPRLEAVADELGVREWVDLPGFLPNPLPIMRRVDLYVMSSQSEGFPMVLVEALFCGCPVVATRCSSAVEEVLEHGALGELVPTRDPESLAAAALRTLASEIDRDKLRERAGDFSVDRIVDRYEGLFRS